MKAQKENLELDGGLKDGGIEPSADSSAKPITGLKELNAREPEGEIDQAGLGRFERLISHNLISKERLAAVVEEARASGRRIEDVLIGSKTPKHEIMRSVSEYFGLPIVEYDERLSPPAALIEQLDLEALKRQLWFPLSVKEGRAKVVIREPDPLLSEEIKKTLKAAELKLVLALPSDIVSFIENIQDINPNFPPSASRTTLAKLRTWLAGQRVFISGFRTTLAQGRTGLAFMRTGVSFISISLVLFRLFGMGYLSLIEALLLVVGTSMAIDGFTWYLPVRKMAKKHIEYLATEPTFGTTVLELTKTDAQPSFKRSAPVTGAEELRAGWNRLSPVQKRRFFASDRTDLAEERTILAGYRTLMARSRTGLAFARTGISFIGLGVAFFREFRTGPWSIFDGALILLGFLMTLEGFKWYFPGREAGKASHEAVSKAEERTSIWDFMFPPFRKHLSADDLPAALSIGNCHAPGIWGTTGLALERTLIADRRNVKARLRTVMARSRTGLAFIRTGTSIFSVGLGLMVFFGIKNGFWNVFNICLMVIGFILMVDGTCWHFPANRIRKSFPYCFNDMEIVFPDYAKPCWMWKKVYFNHEDL